MAKYYVQTLDRFNSLVAGFSTKPKPTKKLPRRREVELIYGVPNPPAGDKYQLPALEFNTKGLAQAYADVIHDISGTHCVVKPEKELANA